MNTVKLITLSTIVCFCFNSNSYAQKSKKHRGAVIVNLQNFDKKRIHFGFALGFNSTDFSMEHDLSVVDSLYKLESQRQSGFHLGIISDLHLGPYFNLRFIPSLAFSQRDLEYTSLKSDNKFETITKPVESTFINFPLNLKYRSFRQENFAMYILGGAVYSRDLASQHKTDNENALPADIVVKLKNNSYSWEIGVGMDLFLEYFKFSPELKMTYGLNNLIINDNTIYSDPIRSLKSKILMLSFNFEG